MAADDRQVGRIPVAVSTASPRKSRSAWDIATSWRGAIRVRPSGDGDYRLRPNDRLRRRPRALVMTTPDPSADRPVRPAQARRRHRRVPAASWPASSSTSTSATTPGRCSRPAGCRCTCPCTSIRPSTPVGSTGCCSSGGADVDPALYGADRGDRLYPPEPARDRVELGLIDVARRRDELPVLGICRGLQLLNVWGGGTLHQHVPDARPLRRPADTTASTSCRSSPARRLHELYGRPHRGQLAAPPDRRPRRRRVDRHRPQRRRHGRGARVAGPRRDRRAVAPRAAARRGAPTRCSPGSSSGPARWRSTAQELTSCAGRLSSSDADDLLRAERDVQARLAGSGIDVDLDFASMAAVANVFRVASAARGHLERTVLADVGLSFTAFTVMWVLWVWGEMESRDAGHRRRRSPRAR